MKSNMKIVVESLSAKDNATEKNVVKVRLLVKIF